MFFFSPWKIIKYTWNPKLEVLKIVFLLINWVILSFYDASMLIFRGVHAGKLT